MTLMALIEPAEFRVRSAPSASSASAVLRHPRRPPSRSPIILRRLAPEWLSTPRTMHRPRLGNRIIELSSATARVLQALVPAMDAEPIVSLVRAEAGTGGTTFVGHR